MSDAVLVALISGGCSILAVLAGRLWSRQEHKATYLLVNSRMEEMLKTAETAGQAKGFEEGRQAAVTEAERVADRSRE